jgi:hypothetical protein
MLSRLYLPLHWSDVTETSHIALNSNAKQTVQVSLISVNNERHFTWTPKQFFVYISPSMGGTYLKLHYLALNAHPLQKLHVWLKSVNNEGHFIWRAKYLASISRLPFDVYSSNFTPQSLCACASNGVRLFEIGQ